MGQSKRQRAEVINHFCDQQHYQGNISTLRNSKYAALSQMNRETIFSDTRTGGDRLAIKHHLQVIR